MHPHLRAAADKLIFDVANVRHIAANLPKKALDRRVEATGLTLRDTFAAMAAAQQDQLQRVERLFDVEPLSAAALRRVPEYRPTKGKDRQSAKDSLHALDRSRDALIALYDRFSDARAEAALGDEALGDVLLDLAHHLEPFALDLAETLPELTLDPMLLNWVLHADFEDRPPLVARQQRLYDQIRAAIEAEERADGSEESGE